MKGVSNGQWRQLWIIKELIVILSVYIMSGIVETHVIYSYQGPETVMEWLKKHLEKIDKDLKGSVKEPLREKSKYGVFLVWITPHSGWRCRDTPIVDQRVPIYFLLKIFSIEIGKEFCHEKILDHVLYMFVWKRETQPWKRHENFIQPN